MKPRGSKARAFGQYPKRGTYTMAKLYDERVYSTPIGRENFIKITNILVDWRPATTAIPYCFGVPSQVRTRCSIVNIVD